LLLLLLLLLLPRATVRDFKCALPVIKFWQPVVMSGSLRCTVGGAAAWALRFETQSPADPDAQALSRVPALSQPKDCALVPECL
jgi:hypothetical protein